MGKSAGRRFSYPGRGWRWFYCSLPQAERRSFVLQNSDAKIRHGRRILARARDRSGILFLPEAKKIQAYSPVSGAKRRKCARIF
jgi:hypothetical protein